METGNDDSRRNLFCQAFYWPDWNILEKAACLWAGDYFSCNKINGYDQFAYTTFKIIHSFSGVFGLVFLSIVNFMKIIVNYAENEDWQAPKQRKKK